MISSRDIRQQFVDHFAKGHDHAFVPSASVVPHDDPTLLFTNAGMNQFKDVFLGTGSRPYVRAVNSQKCVRAGGKHNDLEDVGRDTYHHTFFEMLGNWSFGDYFKRDAIGWSWSLLTETFEVPRDRLHVTVFGGDIADGVEPDVEAESLWREVTDIDPTHITHWGRKENFWEMGNTGPCGPCSEIHIDLTPDASGGDRVNADDPAVIELWNLVFIQFNRDAAGKLSELPARHVDTGLGLERLTRVLQGVDSNYDTDLFRPIFDAVAEITGAPAYGATLDGPADIAYRVVADHIRALTFCIADGAAPGNEGRGYVLRRILRRAVRHGWQTLGIQEPFLHRLVPTVVEIMSDAFPELTGEAAKVAECVKDEEASFSRTLARGIALFEKVAASGTSIGGDSAFRLHDTYGFPLDLTEVMAKERDITVDVEGFNQRMEAAREMARASVSSRCADQVLSDLVQRESLEATRFTGYEDTVLDGDNPWCLYSVRDDGYQILPAAQADTAVVLVSAQTPFYGEAGGQAGDRGTIHAGEAVLQVDTTVKVGAVVLHFGTVTEGPFPGDGNAMPLRMVVDADDRRGTMANHTCTHLLNQALRRHVHAGIDQKGSSVTEQRLRFDLGHEVAVTEAQMRQVESDVNGWIQRDATVYTGMAQLEEGIRINGLRAVFGEKYPPRVRIVSVGVPVESLFENPENIAWSDHSIEFCGGTHLLSTGVAEDFVILQEEAVSKGVRRITAMTGTAARQVRDTTLTLDRRLAEAEASADTALTEMMAGLTHDLETAQVSWLARVGWRDRITTLQKRVKEYQKQTARSASNDVVSVARQVAEEGDERLIVAEIPGADARTLRTAMDVIRKIKPEAALLLAASGGGRVAFVSAVPLEMIERGLKAGDWVKVAAQVTGGGGGGRPDMAQAGGRQPEKIGDALEAARRHAAAVTATA